MKQKEESQEPSRDPSAERSEAGDTIPATSVPAGFRASRGDQEETGETVGQSGGVPSPSQQDQIATPAPLMPRPTPPEDQPLRTSVSLRLAVGLSLLVSLLSLALSGFLFFRLMTIRQTFNDGLNTAIRAIDSFYGEGFQYEYQFERMMPVSADIPIQQELVFPFEGDIPINTTVEVPIDAGILGTLNLQIPIDTSVYVDTSVPVKVDQTFEVSTTIPISMTIPIDIQPDDPAIQNLLGQVRRWLMQLQQSF